MILEDKEEFKKLMKEVLFENSKILSAKEIFFKVSQVYKDVDIPQESEQYVIDAKLEGAETIIVNRKFKWMQLQSISETSKSEQDLFEIKKLYKLHLDSGSIYCKIEDIETFETQWEEAMLAYGFI